VEDLRRTHLTSDLRPGDDSPLPVDFDHSAPPSQVEKISPVENVENCPTPTFTDVAIALSVQVLHCCSFPSSMPAEWNDVNVSPKRCHGTVH
jgi:hypothetical protein